MNHLVKKVNEKVWIKIYLVYKLFEKLLFTHLRRLKNTSKLFKYPSAVNCRILLEPAAVNY